MLAFWLVSALCALLIVALWATLEKQRGEHGVTTPSRGITSLLQETAAQATPSPASMESRLTLLHSLLEQSISHSGTVSRQEYCRAVLERACTVTGASRGEMMLWDEHRHVLRVAAGAGEDGPATPELRSGEKAAGRAFQTGHAQTDEAARGDEPFLAVPLLAKSKPLGTLNLFHPAANGVGSAAGALPTEADRRFLDVLAGQAALTIHNLELFDNLQNFYLEMVQTLARAAEARDALAIGQSDRARANARKLAEQLKMDEEAVRNVEYAAMLHRVGKIGIDQTLLNKPGKLTPKEYEEIKKYTAIGHQILSSAQFLGPVADMVLYHQEWFNGQGYPKGLKGEAIPRGSRIVAVINAWEAMMSDRPYRKALARDVAIGELRKGAGSQFDPAVVDAFLQVLAEAK